MASLSPSPSRPSPHPHPLIRRSSYRHLSTSTPQDILSVSSITPGATPTPTTSTATTASGTNASDPFLHLDVSSSTLLSSSPGAAPGTVKPDLSLPPSIRPQPQFSAQSSQPIRPPPGLPPRSQSHTIPSPQFCSQDRPLRTGTFSYNHLPPYLRPRATARTMETIWEIEEAQSQSQSQSHDLTIQDVCGKPVVLRPLPGRARTLPARPRWGGLGSAGLEVILESPDEDVEAEMRVAESAVDGPTEAKEKVKADVGAVAMEPPRRTKTPRNFLGVGFPSDSGSGGKKEGGEAQKAQVVSAMVVEAVCEGVVVGDVQMGVEGEKDGLNAAVVALETVSLSMETSVAKKRAKIDDGERPRIEITFAGQKSVRKSVETPKNIEIGLAGTSQAIEMQRTAQKASNMSFAFARPPVANSTSFVLKPVPVRPVMPNRAPTSESITAPAPGPLPAIISAYTPAPIPASLSLRPRQPIIVSSSISRPAPYPQPYRYQPSPRPGPIPLHLKPYSLNGFPFPEYLSPFTTDTATTTSRAPCLSRQKCTSLKPCHGSYVCRCTFSSSLSQALTALSLGKGYVAWALLTRGHGGKSPEEAAEQKRLRKEAKKETRTGLAEQLERRGAIDEGWGLEMQIAMRIGMGREGFRAGREMGGKTRWLIRGSKEWVAREEGEREAREKVEGWVGEVERMEHVGRNKKSVSGEWETWWRNNEVGREVKEIGDILEERWRRKMEGEKRREEKEDENVILNDDKLREWAIPNIRMVGNNGSFGLRL